MLLSERLERFVTRPNGEDGCWEWNGPRYLGVAGTTYTPRRAFFELKYDVPPEGTRIVGACATENCVSPHAPHTILKEKGSRRAEAFYPKKNRLERGIFFPRLVASAHAKRLWLVARAIREKRPKAALAILKVVWQLRPNNLTRTAWERRLLEMEQK